MRPLNPAFYGNGCILLSTQKSCPGVPTVRYEREISLPFLVNDS